MSTNCELRSFRSDDALAESVAESWVMETKARAGEGALVALSGGRIARKLFVVAASLGQRERGVFGNTDFFWGDERCVPPDDPESNFGIAQKLLLEPLGIKEERIHRIRGEDTPERAAEAAERKLIQTALVGDDGIPVLGLIFLGMGEDGHVASLFPEETAAARSSKAIYRAVRATKPPPQRITLGYGVIAAARAVWVLASGAGKEDALRASLEEKGETPLARVLQARSGTVIFSDINI